MKKSLILSIGIVIYLSPLLAMDNEISEIEKLRAELNVQKIAINQLRDSLNEREARLIKREAELEREKAFNGPTEKFSLWGLEPLKFEFEPMLDYNAWVEWEMKRIEILLGYANNSALQDYLTALVKNIAPRALDPRLAYIRTGIKAKTCFKFYYSTDIKRVIDLVMVQIYNEKPQWMNWDFLEAFEEDIIEELAHIMLFPNYYISPRCNRIAQMEDDELNKGMSPNHERANFVLKMKHRILGYASNYKRWNSEQPMPLNDLNTFLTILRNLRYSELID